MEKTNKSNLFCSACDNLLTNIATPDSFYFRCNKCQKNYQPSANDTLRYEEIKGSDLQIFRAVLLNANEDPVNPKVYKTCKKCKHKIAKQVRLGQDMKLVNICIKCKHSWFEDAVEDAVED